MPSELWGLENGAEDDEERKTVEGRHNEDEEADEEKKNIWRKQEGVSSGFSGLKA